MHYSWDTECCLSINFVLFSYEIFNFSNLLLNLSNPLGSYFSILCLSKVKYRYTSKEGMWLTWVLNSAKPQIYFYQCNLWCIYHYIRRVVWIHDLHHLGFPFKHLYWYPCYCISSCWWVVLGFHCNIMAIARSNRNIFHVYCAHEHSIKSYQNEVVETL